jgi:hypothetical protein
MSTNLVATARIVVPYTVSGRLHKARAYCKGATLVGADWYINSRTTDANDQLWSDAAEQFGYVVGLMLPSSVSYGALYLETLQSAVWVAVAFHTDTLTPGADALVPYSQVTVTLRTTDNKKVRIEVLDTNQPLFQQSKLITAGNAGMDAALLELTPGHVSAHAPYVWQVGRNNQYLNTTPFVSVSSWHNRKLAAAQGV